MYYEREIAGPESSLKVDASTRLLQKRSSRNYSTFEAPPEPSWYDSKKAAIITIMLSASFLLFGALVQIPWTNAATCWRSTSCTAPSTPAFPGVWDKYIVAPTTRTDVPISFFKTNGGFVTTYPGSMVINPNGDQIIFDFGKLTAGIASVTYSASGTGQIGLAFTEAKDYTGSNSDFSNGSGGADGAVFSPTISSTSGTYTVDDVHLRGGFRYLTVFTSGSITVTINAVSIELGYQPDWSNLHAHQGYFYSSDDQLNKIWYAGAYTLQTNAIPAGTGRHWPILGSGWQNDMNLDLGTNYPTIYVDGSKRDRTAWSGDLAVGVPSILVSLSDWNGVRNTINVFLNDQSSSGEFPFAGPAINIYGSDTYHMAVLIGIYDYMMWTNDLIWLNNQGVWAKYKAGMAFITAKIDSTGLLYVTGNNDWGRLSQGGHNSEAQMIMYKTLTSSVQVANWANDATSAANWGAMATKLLAAINANNWDSSAGAYKESATDASIHPQDANALSLLFGVAPSASSASVSTALTKNWNSIGAVAPELPNNIIGFGSSFEVKGHFAVGQTTRALDLIRRSWGWYLNNADGTQSTCIEGYLADGTFGYRNTQGYPSYSYTSHAHGWSTGPTEALTSYVLGLTLTAASGTKWNLAPQYGDLTHAEGGFTTPLGQFSAYWTVTAAGVTAGWNMPTGTTGTFKWDTQVSAAMQAPTVSLDGALQKREFNGYNATTGVIELAVQGGNHTISIVF